MKKKLSVAMFGQKRLSREGGVEIVVKELCTRMAKAGHKVTCYNRSGDDVSGAEYDRKTEYTGIRQRSVPTIEKKGLAAVSSSFFAALCSAFGRYDVVHIHVEKSAFFRFIGLGCQKHHFNIWFSEVLRKWRKTGENNKNPWAYHLLRKTAVEYTIWPTNDTYIITVCWVVSWKIEKNR